MVDFQPPFWAHPLLIPMGLWLPAQGCPAPAGLPWVRVRKWKQRQRRCGRGRERGRKRMGRNHAAVGWLGRAGSPKENSPRQANPVSAALRPKDFQALKGRQNSPRWLDVVTKSLSRRRTTRLQSNLNLLAYPPTFFRPFRAFIHFVR